MNDNLLQSVSRGVSKVGFEIKKKSPEILIVTGLILAASSVVLACFETKKLDEIVKPAKEKITNIHSHLDNTNEIMNKQYDPEEGKKELRKTYLSTGGKIILLYSPAFLAFVLASSCILGANKIMKGRNLALAAAYSTLETGYKEYRKRVEEVVGKEKEEDIYKGNKDVNEEIENKDGTKTIVSSKKPTNRNTFSVLYSCNNRGWERDAQLNLSFLLELQAFMNDTLKVKGYVFLYQVYDALGMDVSYLGEDRVRASHILGWIYDPSDKSRDSYISFGLTDEKGNVKQNIVNQLKNNEPDMWIDLNYDGDILSGDNNKRTFAKNANML
jgi:hypothetical protein